jgi:tetratricopeptide (TPR) repeat protein
MDEQGHPVFVDLSTEDVEKVRARVAQATVSTPSPLEAALKLPPAQALEALESLARQHPDSSVYIKLQSRLHTDLMERYAKQGLWKEALAHANEAVRLGDDDPWTLAQRAFLFWLAGDVAGYRASCASLVERNQSREDPEVLRPVAGAAILRPEALDDYSGLLEQVRRSLPWAGGWDGPAQRFELGFVLARAGQYAQALKELEELDRFLGTGVPVRFPPTLNKFMISICHAHLGDLEEARRWFHVAARETQPLLQADPATLSGDWWARPALEVFMKEAETLLRTPPSKPGHSK